MAERTETWPCLKCGNDVPGGSSACLKCGNDEPLKQDYGIAPARDRES